MSIFYLFIYLFIYLFVYLFIYLFIYYLFFASQETYPIPRQLQEKKILKKERNKKSESSKMNENKCWVPRNLPLGHVKVLKTA